MENLSEDLTLAFFKSLGFPGIRKGEKNTEICRYLRDKGYLFTPDLVAGPQNIAEAEIEGLFFIDVIEPTSDMLFIEKFYKGYDVNIPKIFKDKLKYSESTGKPLFIDDIPNDHHEFYLDKLNDKIQKYAHHRKFRNGEKELVSANFGIVHYFDLGKLSNNSVSELKTFITVLDYIRFYKRLAPSDNADIKNAENIIMNEIVNENQSKPLILTVGRELADLPCLFLMMHLTVIKKSNRKSISLIVLNISHLGNSDGKYPIHNWFISRIFHPESVKYSNDEYVAKEFSININPSAKMFE